MNPRSEQPPVEDSLVDEAPAVEDAPVEPVVEDAPIVDEPVHDPEPEGEVFVPIPAPKAVEVEGMEDTDMIEMVHPGTPGSDTAFVSWAAFRETWGPKGWRRVSGRNAEGQILLAPEEKYDAPPAEVPSASDGGPIVPVETDLTADGEGISGQPVEVETPAEDAAPGS
jgi:hypothetical protein